MNNFKLQLENYIKTDRKIIPDIMMVDSSYNMPMELCKYIKCIKTNFTTPKGEKMDVFKIDRKKVTEEDMLKFTDHLLKAQVSSKQMTKKDYEKDLEDYKIRKKIGLTK